MTKFRFRTGHHCRGVVQDIGDELNSIAERDGGLKPQVVVEEARPAGSVLHDHFEWDNDAAAEQHRLWQARELIRAVIIVSDGDEDGLPAFVNVSVSDGRAYQPLAQVMMNPSYLESAVALLTAKLEQASDALASLRRVASEDLRKQKKITRIHRRVAEASELARSLTE